MPVEVDGKTEEWLVNFKMRPTTTQPKSSRLVELQPVLVEQSVTRCQDVPMYIRQCV